MSYRKLTQSISDRTLEEHPITERDLAHLDWKGLSTRRLKEAWDGDEDVLYDYL
jgi:hypothetical protein